MVRGRLRLFPPERWGARNESCRNVPGSAVDDSRSAGSSSGPRGPGGTDLGVQFSIRPADGFVKSPQNAQGRVTTGVTRPWKESEHRALSPGSANSRVVSHATPPGCSVALPDRLSVKRGAICIIGAKRITATTGTAAMKRLVVASHSLICHSGEFADGSPERRHLAPAN